MNPLVSIVIPTRNRPGVLQDALASLAHQHNIDSADVEAIVVNDHGVKVDAVVEQARNHGLNVETIRLKRRGGLPVARNAGIEAARGEFVGFLDDDDVFLPGHLSTLLGAFEPEVDLICGDCLVADRRIDTSGHVPSREAFDFEFRPGLLEMANTIPVHSAIMRNPRRVGASFDAGLPALEDWDFWLRLHHRHQYRFAHVATPTVVYHRIPGEASMTGDAGYAMTGLAAFGGIVQQLWQRWPATSLKVTRFRGYLGNMYWLALAEFARGHVPHFSYYLRSIKALVAAWTGELPEAALVGALADAVREESADACAVA